MKKTIWQPLVLGVVLGLLGGLTRATGLFFLVFESETYNSIGLFGIFFLLAAAMGGPLAGVTTSTVDMIISTLYGSPELKELLTIPEVFWSNVFAAGLALVLVGLAYRMIFERVRLPARLLPWAGIVIVFYLILSPTSITVQNLLLGDPRSDILPAVIFSYRSYIPQAIFDIFTTSLVFIALPRSFTRPLWYRVKSVAPPSNGEE